MKINILIVDDHPSMVEGYKIILSYNTLGIEIESSVAYNCESAYRIITNPANKKLFDIVFLDYSLPAFKEMDISNGEDLALLVKNHMPETKVVILTSHTESILLYGIIKNIAPNGLLVKSDFSADELLLAFDLIMKGETYHSETVKSNVKELLSRRIYLDDFNRQIIVLLSQGIKTKNLPNYISLSISAIEKRKVQIRDYFCIKNGNDEDMIREAKKLGLL